MKRNTKLLNFISYITLVLAFMGIMTVTVWYLYPYEPLVLNNEPVKIVDKEISPGEPIKYEVDFCKSMDKTVTVRRRIVDGVIWQLPEIKTSANGIGCHVQTIAIDVPKALPSGEYSMVIEYSYHVNPVRDIVILTKTEGFTIL